jgi:hypothetical protein
MTSMKEQLQKSQEEANDIKSKLSVLGMHTSCSISNCRIREIDSNISNFVAEIGERDVGRNCFSSEIEDRNIGNIT